MELPEIVQVAITAVLSLLGLFSAIARKTPNKSDNKLADRLWKIVNSLGLRGGPTD